MSGLINCQSTCNKFDEISDVVKHMDLDVVFITDTWLTGNVSDQRIVGDVNPARYPFDHVARIHKKSGGVGILLRDSLKCETHLRFQAKSFLNYQLTFESRGVSVSVAIIYWLQPTKNGLKVARYSRELLTLRSTNLKQQVQNGTQGLSHILDLFMFREYDNLIKDVSVSSMVFDLKLFHIKGGFSR